MRYTLLLFSFVLAIPGLAMSQAAPAQSPPRAGTSQTTPRTATPQTPPRTAAPQTPPRTAAPQAPAPAQPRPRTTRPAPAPARSGMAITVADANGATLGNIHVDVSGPMSRTGDTNAAGQVNFPGLPAGMYRIRFTGDDVITLEREATLAAGRVTSVQVTLNRAEPKSEPEPVEAPAPPPAAGPVGSPQWGSLTDLAKRAAQSKPPRQDVLLACSGDTRSMLLLMTEDQPQRVYDDAESTFYVLDGQGAITISDKTGAVSEGSFVSVPRGMSYSVTRRGSKPLVMLWVLSGAPCEEAR